MGRVIKGSPVNPERFTVAIPVFAAPHGDGAAEEDDIDATFDMDRPIGFALPDPPPEPEPVPTIDIDAIAAQAQELIDDAARSAETLVDEARERARALIEEANAQAATATEEARRTGHEQGYASGTQAAHDETQTMLTTMRELLESSRNERHALINAAEPELVRLAVGIAERVLHQQIALDAGVVVEMAKAAISRTLDREKITVRVNPADMERMREHRDELLALGDVKTMRVIEDQRVERGGVIVETDGGSIDAKISTQLTEVRKILHIVDDVVMQPASQQPLDHDAEPPAARAS